MGSQGHMAASGLVIAMKIAIKGYNLVGFFRGRS